MWINLRQLDSAGVNQFRASLFNGCKHAMLIQNLMPIITQIDLLDAVTTHQIIECGPANAK